MRGAGIVYTLWIIIFTIVVRWAAHNIAYTPDGLWDRAIHDISFDGLIIMLADAIARKLSLFISAQRPKRAPRRRHARVKKHNG